MDWCIHARPPSTSGDALLRAKRENDVCERRHVIFAAACGAQYEMAVSGN